MVIVGGQPGHGALDAALDVFRMRQYFNVVVRARDSLKFLRRKITYGGGTSLTFALLWLAGDHRDRR